MPDGWWCPRCPHRWGQSGGAAAGIGAPVAAPVSPVPAVRAPADRVRGAGREPADPAAVIATLGPDGRLYGRADRERVDVGPGMLRDALAAVAEARGKVLRLAGRPSQWLGMPHEERRSGRRTGGGAREWDALEIAKRGAWAFTSYDMASGKRIGGYGCWTDARHPELVPDVNGRSRWITLHIPELDPTVAAVLDLTADELHEASALASRALGRRWAEWEGGGFRELVQRVHGPGASLAVPELPAASQQHTETTWSRTPEPTPAEWEAWQAEGARLWVFDRSASYLSALPRVSVGVGDLERHEGEAAGQVAREHPYKGGSYRVRPGSYLVRLTGPDPLAARELPPALDAPELWVPAPTVALLLELGAEFEIVRAEVWLAGSCSDYFRRVAEGIKAARAGLLARTDPAGRVALEIVKATYTRGLQMLDRHAAEASPKWQRPDVYAAIVQSCRANLLRDLVKAKVPPLAYVKKDTVAWPVVAETAEDAARRIGLRYGREPGAWREVGSWELAEVRARVELPAGTARSADRLSRARMLADARPGGVRVARPAAASTAPAGRSLALVVRDLMAEANGRG